MESKQRRKKKKKSNISLIILLLILIITVITVFIVKNNKGNSSNIENNDNEKEKINYNEENQYIEENVGIENIIKDLSNNLIKEKEYKGMKIENIKIIKSDETDENSTNIKKFSILIHNTTDNKYEGGNVTIVFRNEDNSEFSKLEMALPEINPGEATRVEAGTTANIQEANNFTIE